MTATKVGIRVECTTCHQQKAPRGRSAPVHGHYCDWDCAGYLAAPLVGTLWPGETEADYGYPCGDDGTKPVAR